MYDVGPVLKTLNAFQCNKGDLKRAVEHCHSEGWNEIYIWLLKTFYNLSRFWMGIGVFSF